MSLMYQLLLQRSGLSLNDAAKLHQVPVKQVKFWARFKMPVPEAALHALERYCHDAETAAANDNSRA